MYLRGAACLNVVLMVVFVGATQNGMMEHISMHLLQACTEPR